VQNDNRKKEGTWWHGTNRKKKKKKMGKLLHCGGDQARQGTGGNLAWGVDQIKKRIEGMKKRCGNRPKPWGGKKTTGAEMSTTVR